MSVPRPGVVRHALVVFALTVGAARVAQADGAEERRAEQLFTEGQAAFEAGDFRRAAAAFEAAYTAKRHPAVLWNAARSWQRAGEDLRAATDLDRYLRGTTADAPHRDEATKSLAEIAKHIGRVQLRSVGVKDGMVDGEPCGEPMCFVAPGEHVATGQDDAGRTVRKVFVTRAGETVSIVLAGETKRETSETKDATKNEPETRAATDMERKRPSRPLSPWVVVGGSVLTTAGITLTVLSALETVGKAHAFDQEQTAARLDDGYASQMRTNVGLGVTAGVAALTALAAIFFVDWGAGANKTPARSGQR